MSCKKDSLSPFTFTKMNTERLHKHNIHRMVYKSLFVMFIFFLSLSLLVWDRRRDRIAKVRDRERPEPSVFSTLIDSNVKSIVSKGNFAQSQTLMPLATIALCTNVLYLTLLFCLNAEQIVPIYIHSVTALILFRKFSFKRSTKHTISIHLSIHI